MYSVLNPRGWKGTGRHRGEAGCISRPWRHPVSLPLNRTPWRFNRRYFETVEDAKRKDGGLDPAAISYLLSTVEVGSIPQYLAKNLQPEQLQAYIHGLGKRMAEIAYPES